MLVVVVALVVVVPVLLLLLTLVVIVATRVLDSIILDLRELLLSIEVSFLLLVVISPKLFVALNFFTEKILLLLYRLL